jgi:hypothetical protein
MGPAKRNKDLICEQQKSFYRRFDKMKKILSGLKKAVVSNEQATQKAKETASAIKNRPADGDFAEFEMTAAQMNFIVGQLGGIILEKDPNANNPLTLKDYLGFPKQSADVNFIVEFKGHSVGIIGGREIKGCSKKASSKWLERVKK